jgi:hypothetical protein
VKLNSYIRILKCNNSDSELFHCFPRTFQENYGMISQLANTISFQVLPCIPVIIPYKDVSLISSFKLATQLLSTYRNYKLLDDKRTVIAEQLVEKTRSFVTSSTIDFT